MIFPIASRIHDTPQTQQTQNYISQTIRNINSMKESKIIQGDTMVILNFYSTWSKIPYIATMREGEGNTLK